MYNRTLSLTLERMGWVISATLRWLYHRERDLDCTGGWMGAGAGLDGCGKSRPTGIRSPDSSARNESLHRVPVLTSSCHRLYYKSFALIWTQPTTWTAYVNESWKQSTQGVFKILFANSLICSENGFIKTPTHKKKCNMEFRNWFANRHPQTTWATATNRRIPPTRPLVKSK